MAAQDFDEDYDIRFTYLNDDTFDSLTSEQETSSISIMSDTGSLTTITDDTRFIVHTSTIPYANIMNVAFKNTTNYIEHDISCENCMLGKYKLMPIQDKCPCLDLDESLHETCFLTFLKTIKNYDYLEDEDYPVRNPKEFTFCKDSVNILSHKYPSTLRKITGVTGFHQIDDIDKLNKLFKTLYWFKFTTNPFQSFLRQRNDFIYLLRSIKQTIYTINGLLTKLFFIVCEYNYKDVAIKTAKLFEDIMFDYMKKPNYIDEGTTVETVTKNESIMLELKDFHKHVKTYFNCLDYEKRINVFNYKFNFESLQEFFDLILNKLSDSYNRYFLQEGRDFSETLSWKFSMSLLLQTRSLGYLPQRVAFYQDQKYRSSISTVRENPTPEVTRMIEIAIKNELLMYVPLNIYNTTDTLSEDKYSDEALKALNNVDMPIKMAASYDTILAKGGKLEDCRLLIKFAIENDINIPVRDLKTNAIKEYFKATDTQSYSKIAFWLSYELAYEYLIIYAYKQKQRIPFIEPYEGFKFIFPIQKINTFLHATILHIQEPLKQRNLTKSTSELTWFLTPGGKMLQEVLAKLPEHTVGLKYSSDAWKFQQQLHPHSAGGFIFKNDEVLSSRFVYSDWTEASDNINKKLGYHHLKAIMEYSAFPLAYRGMILHILLIPQPVKEVLQDNNLDKVLFKGAIRNGFMMGNPITKSILHLLHVSELRIAKDFQWRKYGVKFQRFIPNLESVQKDINFITYMNDKSFMRRL
jgi:hypothetical protein